MATEFKIKASGRKHLDFSGCEDEAAKEWKQPFMFVQAADSQFGLIDRYLKGLDRPGWDEEMALSEEFVASCNRLEPKPKFVVVCGDLLDAYPWLGELRERQTEDFKRIYSKLDPSIPLVCVCGNHDIGDEPKLDAVESYRKTFGDDYFHFVVEGVLFIVINSQFYQHREYVVEYAREQDRWLEGLLDRCKEYKHSVVFEHIPWFLNDWDEEKGYFNIEKSIRLEWLEKFRKAGVSKIMCGHYHRNAGGWYQEMELVVTSAIGAQLGSDKSGARVVRVLEDRIEHQYYAMADLPVRVEL